MICSGWWAYEFHVTIAGLISPTAQVSYAHFLLLSSLFIIHYCYFVIIIINIIIVKNIIPISIILSSRIILSMQASMSICMNTLYLFYMVNDQNLAPFIDPASSVLIRDGRCCQHAVLSFSAR